MAYNQQPPPYPGGAGYGNPPPPGFAPQYNTDYGQGGQQQQQQGGGGPAPPTFAPLPTGGMGAYVAAQNVDPETGLPKSEFGFDDKTIRRGFIRKVFLIVSVQLAFVCGLIALCVLHEDTNRFVKQNRWLYYLSYGVFLVTYLALACCPSVRRAFPGNVICLSLLTGAMGYMAAMISAHYNIEHVLMAAGICSLCCLGLVLFASQTKFDITKYTGVIAVVSIIFMIFGIGVVITFAVGAGGRILLLVYSCIGAGLFMIYLVYDVQLLIGGGKYELSPEDYVFAAAQIFLDVVQLFLLLLQIIGLSNN